jgi:hypothetical protein
MIPMEKVRQETRTRRQGTGRADVGKPEGFTNTSCRTGRGVCCFTRGGLTTGVKGRSEDKAK